MDSKTYKKLRTKEKEEERIKKIAKEYQEIKDTLIDNMVKFIDSDDLFMLSDVVIVASELLKREGFPIKKYAKRKRI